MKRKAKKKKINKSNIASIEDKMRRALQSKFLHHEISMDRAKAYLKVLFAKNFDEATALVALKKATFSRETRDGETLYSIGHTICGINEIVEVIQDRFVNTRPTIEKVFRDLEVDYAGEVNWHMVRQALLSVTWPCGFVRNKNEKKSVTLHLNPAIYPEFRFHSVALSFPFDSLEALVVRWDQWQPTIIVQVSGDPSEPFYQHTYWCDQSTSYEDVFQESLIDPTTGTFTLDHYHCVPVLFTIHAHALFRNGGSNDISDLYIDELRRLTLLRTNLEDRIGFK